MRGREIKIQSWKREKKKRQQKKTMEDYNKYWKIFQYIRNGASGFGVKVLLLLTK